MHVRVPVGDQVPQPPGGQQAPAASSCGSGRTVPNSNSTPDRACNNCARQPIAGHRGVGVGIRDPHSPGPVAAAGLGPQQMMHTGRACRSHPPGVTGQHLDTRPLLRHPQRCRRCCRRPPRSTRTRGAAASAARMLTVAASSAARQRGSRASSFRAGTTIPIIVDLDRRTPHPSNPGPSGHRDGRRPDQDVQPEVLLEVLGPARPGPIPAATARGRGPRWSGIRRPDAANGRPAAPRRRSATPPRPRSAPTGPPARSSNRPPTARPGRRDPAGHSCGTRSCANSTPGRPASRRGRGPAAAWRCRWPAADRSAAASSR